MLTMRQALWRMRWLRWGGRVLSAVCVLLVFVAAIKGIYSLASYEASGLLAALWNGIKRLIESLYAGVSQAAPGMAGALWRMAPDLDLRRGLFDRAHVSFWLVYAAMFVGVYMRGQANRIGGAIRQHRDRMQQVLWDEQAREQMRQGVAVDVIEQRLDVRISLESQPTPWHQKGWALIAMGILLPLFVEVLKIFLGLAKLP
jgi:hypothetical protein